MPSLCFSVPLSSPQNLFLQFDADKSGTMSSYELRTALKAAGKTEPGRSGVGCAWPGTVCGRPLASRALEVAGLAPSSCFLRAQPRERQSQASGSRLAQGPCFKPLCDIGRNL